MDTPPWSRAPAPPVPRRPCGSRQAWSQPSRAPNPSARSRAGFQHTQHGPNSLRVRAAADPHRHTVDLDLARSSTRLSFALRGFALAANRRFRRGNIHYRWHELQSVCLRKPNLRFSHLPAPAKQLLRRQSVPSGYGTDRLAARYDLSDNPRLVFTAPCPSPPGAGEHLQPANRLRDSNMFSVHSKPNGQNQTADSQITTSSGR